ncbi:ABC transporter ATP-binding protein [Vibrio fluvialis]|nr:ABC transporter ATP-binding protein [Vibrio fluvialis]MBY8086907.1 ABC transporter ATP-binding protein [Vibrio fluvialis]MBY8103958.1 ABC transporter ATP-binding protein [Vibrio fluvialis]
MSFNNPIAIDVEKLSKCYKIYSKPLDKLLHIFRFNVEDKCREFWALSDVSFKVKKGETVAIIGKNGSGKSTLLQLICKTLTATHGSAQSYGRVAALLELGSGFNPEFTGSENIRLYATILGLSQEEINERYESIVTFSEIGDFLNQPVKTYSSGMQVRLAFSVAIHVEPEILIVDEALSVGDAYFQAKCASEIAKIIERGTTVLFVSHDIASVKTLCNRALLLENGKLVFDGGVGEAVELYYRGLVAGNLEKQADNNEHPTIALEEYVLGTENFKKNSNYQRISNGFASFQNVQIANIDSNHVETLDFGEEVYLRQLIRINKDLAELAFAYHIRDKNGQDIVYSDTTIENEQHIRNAKSGDIYLIEWKFDVRLREGNYVISSMASIPSKSEYIPAEVVDFIPISYTFNVSRGSKPQIYGFVNWNNDIKVKRLN